MAGGDRSRARDLTLRVLGLLLMAVAALGLRHLSCIMHVAMRHAATPAELGIAGIGFMDLSTGAVLIFLGIHIFDEVPVSERWSQSPVRPADGRSHPSR